MILLLLLACRTPLDPPPPQDRSDPRPAWGALLAEVVNDDGTVDYDRLEQDRDVLSRYLWWSDRYRVSKGYKASFARYLNAYNATVLHMVLEHGRPASVDRVDGWLPNAFYTAYTVGVGPDRLSLGEMFHERLRHRRMDHRVHGAVNHGTMDSAPLRPELYDADRLYSQLDDQMTTWLSDPERGVVVQDGVAVFPAVFDAYARDFSFWTGGADPCTVAASHVPGKLGRELRALAEVGCPRTFRADDRRLNHRDGTDRDRTPPKGRDAGSDDALTDDGRAGRRVRRVTRPENADRR